MDFFHQRFSDYRYNLIKQNSSVGYINFSKKKDLEKQTCFYLFNLYSANF